MNKTYVFGGGGCIVTSSEIKITPLHGTRPMHPALSKKLYDQNMHSYTRHKKPGVWWQIQYNAIRETVTTINKYTIVELTHNNKHYHGLASRADCDKYNAVTGIAEAYHRAFEKMMVGSKIGIATYDKNSPMMHGSSPGKVVFDGDLAAIGKAYFKNQDWVSYDLPCGKLNEIIDKKSKLVDKAISDLLSCTYIYKKRR